MVAFPAYAGMNRTAPELRVMDACVPRVCGDEPAPLIIGQSKRARSPRMRG